MKYILINLFILIFSVFNLLWTPATSNGVVVQMGILIMTWLVFAWGMYCLIKEWRDNEDR